LSYECEVIHRKCLKPILISATIGLHLRSRSHHRAVVIMIYDDSHHIYCLLSLWLTSLHSIIINPTGIRIEIAERVLTLFLLAGKSYPPFYFLVSREQTNFRILFTPFNILFGVFAQLGLGYTATTGFSLVLGCSLGLIAISPLFPLSSFYSYPVPNYSMNLILSEVKKNWTFSLACLKNLKHIPFCFQFNFDTEHFTSVFLLHTRSAFTLDLNNIDHLYTMYCSVKIVISYMILIRKSCHFPTS
jgi:hypothetical protein